MCHLPFDTSSWDKKGEDIQDNGERNEDVGIFGYHQVAVAFLHSLSIHMTVPREHMPSLQEVTAPISQVVEMVGRWI